MILKTLRRLIGITGLTGPSGPAGAMGATGPPGFTDFTTKVEIKQIQEALGGLWRTQAGELIPFKLLTDTHIHSILEGGFGSSVARAKLRAERQRRNSDDAWAKLGGKLSMRDRITKLEFFAKKAVAPTAGLYSLTQRVKELEGQTKRIKGTTDSLMAQVLSQKPDHTGERIEAMAGELLALRRQVKELKERNVIRIAEAPKHDVDLISEALQGEKVSSKLDLRQEGAYEIGTVIHDQVSIKVTSDVAYEILTTSEAKLKPDTLYLTVKEYNANTKGHNNPPRTYTQRVNARKVEEPKAERTPYSYLGDMLADMRANTQASQPFVFPFIFPKS